MRAALLPTPGEPFMLSYWLRNFETWRDEVDELLVYINGNHEGARDMVVAAGGRTIASETSVGHGPAIERLLEVTDAEHIVLCEDDAYVRTPGAVRGAFERMEGGTVEVVGSPRYEDRYEDPIREWPKKVKGDIADLGRALWPAFLFARRDDLMATDRRFGDIRINIGEDIPGLGVTVTSEMCDFVNASPDYIHVDTFYATTYQLRTKVIELVHRVRLIDAKATERWLRYDPPWFHITGLSAIATVLNGQRDNLPDAGLWERRVAWWERTYRDAPERLRDSGYGSRYRNQLDSFRHETKLSPEAIDQWDARLEPWVTW